ncbi:MAG: efflux RND transporter periplasmic adaptor subunit [Chthoniobacterales bacterium]
MKTKRLFVPVVIAAATLIELNGCKKEEQVALAPPEVLVTEAAARDVPVYREWIGTIDGSENAEIQARVKGHLTKRSYQEGALVKKGDLLFEIDPRPSEAELAQAKSMLEQGKAAALAAAAERDRSDKLFAQKVISDQEHTNKTQLNEANQAKVQALIAAVEEAQLNLNFCKVTSPVEGIAGIAKAQVGDLVGTGSTVVLTSISTLDPAKILFPVSEADYLTANQRIQQNMNKPLEQREEAIELVLADGSTFPNKAKLLSVDRQVQAGTGTILVTALVQNPGSLLRPGFYARARIVAQVLKDAVVIPQRAVSEVQGSYQLGVIGSDGKAEIRPVKVGARIGSDWVISSGLKAGEKIVVEGLQKIKSGAPVTAKQWTAPEDKTVAAVEPAAK